MPLNVVLQILEDNTVIIIDKPVEIAVTIPEVNTSVIVSRNDTSIEIAETNVDVKTLETNIVVDTHNGLQGAIGATGPQGPQGIPGTGSVVSVTGLDTDNTDPDNPVVKVSVDGITITGDGTPGDPLVSVDSGGGEWGEITGTLSDQTDLQGELDNKLDKNTAIVAATKTKITYDEKGLVTLGEDATTADILDSTDARYVTDAELIVIGNTSNTNTGDQSLTGYVPYIGATARLDLGFQSLDCGHILISNSIGDAGLDCGGGVMMGYDSVLNRFNFAEGDFNVSSLGINLLRHTNTYSIKIDAGSATVPPIQLASGTLNTTPQIGAMEFLTDDLYFGLTTPSSIISTSFYPPAQSATYVKSGYLNSSFYSWFATDPTTSVTGTPVGNGWQNTSGQQRFHIDLGSGKIVDRVYYENKHSTGLNTDRGVKDFTLWGSNSSTAFANLTYGTDTDWTELTCDTNVMLEHTGSDIADPNYILVTNITSYRYYAFKFSSNHGSGSYYGIRQLELQSITTADYRRTIVMSDDGLTSGKIPIADIGGRLKDGPTPLAGTKIYYVSDSSGGAVTRKLTFTDGILTSET